AAEAPPCWGSRTGTARRRETASHLPAAAAGPLPAAPSTAETPSSLASGLPSKERRRDRFVGGDGGDAQEEGLGVALEGTAEGVGVDPALGDPPASVIQLLHAQLPDHTRIARPEDVRARPVAPVDLEPP